MGALDTIIGDSACGLTNGRTEIHTSSLEDPGVINTESDYMNKTKFHEYLRHKISMNIYRFDLYQRLNLCVPQFPGGPLASWGPRLKPIEPIGKSGPGWEQYKYSICTGPGLTDARPYVNPLVRPTLPLLQGKKWKALINLRKSKMTPWKYGQ